MPSTNTAPSGASVWREQVAISYKVSMQNEGGELDCRVVKTEREIKQAALELLTGMAHLSPGDRIVVSEVKDRA